MAPMQSAALLLVLLVGVSGQLKNFEQRLFVAPEVQRAGVFTEFLTFDSFLLNVPLGEIDVKDVVVRSELSVKWAPGFEFSTETGTAQLVIFDEHGYILTTINADSSKAPSARAISCPTIQSPIIDEYGFGGDFGALPDDDKVLSYAVQVIGSPNLAFQWKVVVLDALVPAEPTPDFYGLSSPIHVDSSFFSLFFFDYSAKYVEEGLWLRVGLVRLSAKEAEERFQDDRNAAAGGFDDSDDFCQENPGACTTYPPFTTDPALTTDPSATPVGTDYEFPDDFTFDDPYFYDPDSITVGAESLGVFSNPVNPFNDAVLLVHRSDVKECPRLNNPLSGGTPWVHMSFETTAVLTLSPTSQPPLKQGRYFIAVSGGGRVASTYELELEVFEPNKGLVAAILVAFLIPLGFGIVLLCLCHSPSAPCCFTTADPLTRGHHVSKCSELTTIAKFQVFGPVVPNDEHALPEHEQDDIPDAPINQNYHWSFPWFIFSIAAVFGVTAFQVVTSRYKLMRDSGDRDLCFYNERCYHPLPFWDIPFNNFLSNSVYMIAGLVMLAHVFTYNIGLMKTSGLSILYAQGWALVAVGWNSAVYHICPSPSAFQFDTAFMFISAMLIALACYQAGERLTHRFADTPRMDGVKSGKFVVFYLVPLFIFNYIGTRLISAPETVIRPVFAVFVALWEIALFYYVWKRYDEPTAFMRDRKVKPSMQKNPPHVLGGCIDVIWCMCGGPMAGFAYWFLCLIVVGATTYAIAADGVDLATSFLGMNLLISVVAMVRIGAARLSVATQDKPWGRARIRWVKFLMLVMAALWIVAFSFFKLGTSNKSTTPAKSRTANTECTLLGIFDNHDVWHILSGLGLLTQMCLIIFLNPPHEFTDYVKLAQKTTDDLEADAGSDRTTTAQPEGVTSESAPLASTADDVGPAGQGDVELITATS